MFWGFAGTVRWSHRVDGAAQGDGDTTLEKSCDNQSTRGEGLVATRADDDHANDGGSDNNVVGSGSPGGGDAEDGTTARTMAVRMSASAARWRRRRSLADEAAECRAASDVGANDCGVEMALWTTRCNGGGAGTGPAGPMMGTTLGCCTVANFMQQSIGGWRRAERPRISMGGSGCACCRYREDRSGVAARGVPHRRVETASACRAASADGTRDCATGHTQGDCCRSTYGGSARTAGARTAGARAQAASSVRARAIRAARGGAASASEGVRERLQRHPV